MSDTGQRVEVGPVPAALNPRDLRMARTDELSQLLLAQPLVHPVLDEKPRDLPKPFALCLLSSVLGTTGCTPFGSLFRGGADRAGRCSATLLGALRQCHGLAGRGRTRHRSTLSLLISRTTVALQGASRPAARGGRRGRSSIRALKSSNRFFARSMSTCGRAPVRFSSAWRSTKRFRNGPHVRLVVRTRPVPCVDVRDTVTTSRQRVRVLRMSFMSSTRCRSSVGLGSNSGTRCR